MKIAIISDIHDQKENFRWAMEEIKKRHAEHIICLGDAVSPFMYMEFVEGDIPVFGIFGNNEGDRTTIIRVSLEEGGNLTMSDREFSEFEIDGKKFFLAHYPELAEDAAYSGKYDAVFHGHTHIMRDEVINDIPIINPGEVLGYATGAVSFVMFDTQTLTAEFIEKP